MEVHDELVKALTDDTAGVSAPTDSSTVNTDDGTQPGVAENTDVPNEGANTESQDTGESTEANTNSGGDSDESSNAESTETSSGEPRMIPYDRFQEVIRERNELRDALKNAHLQTQQTPPVEEEDELTKEAVAELAKLGFVRRSDVEKVIEAKLAEDKMVAEIEQKVVKLEGEWNGKDGKPKFDRNEVADFMEKNGIYDPEYAFKLLKENELKVYWLSQQKPAPASTARKSTSVQPDTSHNDALLKEATEKQDFREVLKSRLGL